MSLLAACGKSTSTSGNGGVPFGRPAEEQDFQFSAAWPENEFTKQVPKPKFKTALGEPSETELAVVCAATVDELKDYVESLKKAGYTENENTIDETAFGMVAYIYAANNEDGYSVEVNYSNKLGSLTTVTIKKPT
jgi:hypothetical protein